MPDGKGLDETIMSLSDSLSGIGKQQESIIKMLLNMDGTLIRLINEPTEEQMMIAVKQNGMAIQYMLPMKQTDEMKMAAIESNPYCFEFVYEPTKEMWDKAIEVEFPEDCDSPLRTKHPIRLLKDADMPDVRKISLYTTFLEEQPDAFNAIIEDIKGWIGEEFVWSIFLTKWDPPFTEQAKYCPKEIMARIIDNVITKSPYVMFSVNIEFWTYDRLKLIVKDTLHRFPEIAKFVRETYPEKSWEIYKEALNAAKDKMTMRYVLYDTRDHGIDFETFSSMLECDQPLKFLSVLTGIFTLDRDMVTYVLNKFPFESICDAFGDDYWITNHLFRSLGWFDKIRYNMKLKKYRKRQAKEDKNE